MADILSPMLASLADAPLTDPALVYEPKYDGIRAIAEVAAGRVRLWSRLGNEKTSQFPEIVEALADWAGRTRLSVVLDGEIVALDEEGRPAGFQQLQRRIHFSGGGRGARPFAPAAGVRTAFIAFDLLREGRTDLRERPFIERRAALERVFRGLRSRVLRLSESVAGDGRALYKRALDSGWEGLIAKLAQSRYKSGKRTPDWRKLKIVREQEFVIGGWTEPRQSRAHFGALMVGVYEDDPQRPAAGKSGARATGRSAKQLVYVGHVGTGFDERELARVMSRLEGLETTVCPFREPPPSNERPHWVRPRLVAQVKFTEWTSDNRLRHPVYLGLRDDKRAEDVRREPATLHASSVRLNPSGRVPLKPNTSEAALRIADNDKNPRSGASSLALPLLQPRDAGASRLNENVTRSRQDLGTKTARYDKGAGSDASAGFSQAELTRLVDQLDEIQRSRHDGVLNLPDGDGLKVTNLDKVFWPRSKLTKGDLLRYYVQVAPFILPAVRDRPLTMKRLPNGVAGGTFYQHRAPDHLPPNVRAEHVPGDRAVPTRLVGGNLKTLLYMAQLAAISQDPWFSRVSSPDAADQVALDLDPADGVPFARVLDVARWIRDELAALGAVSVPKTSGADGLHIYLPLPPETPYEAGLLFCRIVAEVVTQKHPNAATVERSVRARGKRVYIDCYQNVQGKTLATAYSARGSDYAGVSTPLTWDEIDGGVQREDFTISTAPARFQDVGDLWEALRTSKGVDLSRVSKYSAT